MQAVNDLSSKQQEDAEGGSMHGGNGMDEETTKSLALAVAKAGGGPIAINNVEETADKSAPMDSQTTPKKLNAFELVNLCSGAAINRMFQSSDEKAVQKIYLYASPMTLSSIMDILQEKLRGCEGFIELNTYKGGSKLRAVFDNGTGHVHVKVAVKIAVEDPPLSLVILKRARGDLISFQNLSNQLSGLEALLQCGNSI